MQYPLMSEYVSAIRDASDNLDELAHLVPVLDDHGEPYRSSGAFAVVFKMKDEQTGKCYALKCFLEEQEGRAEAYRLIADELDCIDSSYVTSVKYLEKEIFVDSSCEEDEFPVLLMDWVKGETMETYIANNYQDEYAMGMLCYRFCKMAAWLRSQPFAHGDIKPDNIIVRPDGTLTLVDYDGMFVPAMNGQESPTIGTKDFSHPLRTVDDFDESIDDFALASIALSLKAISMNSTLLDTYGASDRLLFSESDYRTPSSSKAISALQDLMCDKNFCTLYSLFMLALARKELSACSFRLFIGEKPILLQTIEDISTEVTEDEWNEAFIDEKGVKYSKDGRKLLKAPQELKGCYSIKEGIRIICDRAFDWCSSLSNIVIPASVTKIGDSVFSSCSSLSSIVISDGITSIGDSAFSGCRSLSNIVIPASVTSIKKWAFRGCSSLSNIVIPASVTSIGDRAFYDCRSLSYIVIPASVTSIGDRVFYNCKSLKSIVISDGITSIGDLAFADCWSLSNIVIPASVTSIGDRAFRGCRSLSNIVIPASVTSIGQGAFSCCRSLFRIDIPASVTSIEQGAFSGCSSLSSIDIPDSVTSIEQGAFSGCSSLSSIDIPDSVTSIGNRAFANCGSLSSILIPESVTSVGDGAFSDCSSLFNIVILNGVTSIGSEAFAGCNFSNNVKQELISWFGDKIF